MNSNGSLTQSGWPPALVPVISPATIALLEPPERADLSRGTDDPVAASTCDSQCPSRTTSRPEMT